ncbi:MAG: thiamine pyrophosphate-dependent enzyme [Clostridia bacterium]
MKVAEAFVKIIEKEGIVDAFGIPGAGINPVYKYLENSGISHYTMRHEEACVHAADAYYRASQKIAMAICTSGPGATNFVTGMYTANIDSIPVLAVTGQANTWQFKMDPFQCVDIAKICETVAKRTYCVTDAKQFPEIMKEVFMLMRSGRPGPVLIDLPLDIQMTEIDFDIESYVPATYDVPKPKGEDIAAAVDMLLGAKSPVMIMGGGVMFSHSEIKFIKLAETLGVPVVTTYMAKGGIPLEHPLNAGHVGIQVGQPIGNKVFLESDLVLGIGCRFVDRHTGDLKTYREGRKFIHVDIEPTQIGKVIEPDLAIVADAALAIDALQQEFDKRGNGKLELDIVKSLPTLRTELERKTDYDAVPIKPHRVFGEINKAFDADTMFTVGCGITQIWSGQLQKIDKPRKYLPSGGAGTLGFDIPAAFGAKVAHPECHSVTVLGDFGFTFMVEEIAVAAAFKKPIIVVIVNNAYLGLIRQNQKGAYGYEYAVDMLYNQDGTMDYVKVAEGFGCAGERVLKPEDIGPALERAKKSDKTYIIDIICDQDQLCDMGGSIAAIKSFI